MLVYADRCERRGGRKCLEALADDLAILETQPAGLTRHASLVSALMDAGRLLQAIADADFADTGADRLSPAAAATGDFIYRLAAAVCRSWDSNFSDLPSLPPVPAIENLPKALELRVPEGYAFYALYPESYIDAARRLTLGGPPRVIGIRSIGTSLAAIAAAAVGAPPPITVRPFGNPSDRQIAVAAELAAALLAPTNAHYVIVDEGPGRSGSSFGAVAAWLEARGIPPERTSFIVSHDNGPGPDATEANRARWLGTQRAVGDFGDHLPRLLAKWAGDALGPFDEPLVDISAGAWRRHIYTDEAEWPAADPSRERRKYLARAGGETWLFKFAGLGALGAHKLARATALYTAGWAPEPRGFVHGFLIERWHSERRFDPPQPAEIACYLGARAALFPAGPESGASLTELFEMSRRNVELALGATAAAPLQRWEPRLSQLAARAVPVEIDNRLDRHEWLRLPDGRLLKTDALDHHAGHDLIGCQDIAWDVAGAAVEFGLDQPATEALAADVGRTAGRSLDSGLLKFFTIAYLAFRLGQTTLASEASDAESPRLKTKARAYANILEQRLSQPA